MFCYIELVAGFDTNIGNVRVIFELAISRVTPNNVMKSELSISTLLGGDQKKLATRDHRQTAFLPVKNDSSLRIHISKQSQSTSYLLYAGGTSGHWAIVVLNTFI